MLRTLAVYQSILMPIKMVLLIPAYRYFVLKLEM